MHSILESDGILSDPYEVLCSIGTLIIEGRTSKIVLDSNHTSEHNEVTSKTVKPYSEGPHCSNHVSKTSKDAHKCVENNVLCIRYKNLRQHLQHLRRMSPSITIEVSLGPDCLCGELRSQSTLVSTQPSKRDTVLEQWRIDMVAHQGQECQNTQMSVLNVYQAVRSLLHFSQLAAWYTSTNGTKPAHVSYRVVVPDDATYIADDKFMNHNLPTVNINNTVSIKMTLKTLPRTEAIPTVFCLQHPASPSESSSSGNSRFLESSDRKNYRSLKSSEPSLTSSSKADALEDTLPLKFHGVRKKTNDVQERKRKKHITLYASSTPLVLDGCSSAEILDGIPVNVKEGTNPDLATSQRNPSAQKEGETSKVEFKKSKHCTFLEKDLLAIVKHQNDINGIPCNYLEQKLLDALVLDLKGLGDTKKKCDYRTKDMNTVKSSVANVIDKKTIIDILDDRMQISCAISGKHHCKWECDEETDLGNAGGTAEKPKRRRSLSKAVIGEGFDESVKSDGLDFEKIFHGKFKDVECLGESRITEDCESTKPNSPSCSKTIPSDQVVSLNIKKSCVSQVKSLPLTNLPQSEKEQEVNESGNSSDRVRKESLASFKKDCEVASIAPESSSDSELSDSFLESSNPFLAAILRTTRKSKSHEGKRLNGGGERSGSKEGVKPKTGSCANSSLITDSLETEEITNPFKYFLTRKKISEFEVKGKDTFKKSKLLEKPWHLNEGGLNFKFTKRKSAAVKGPEDLNLEDSPKKSSVFEIDEKKIKHEGIKEADFLEENSAINFSQAKTIPVPSAHDKLRFRRSLDTAAQLVFHRCSGLPLTSSPAPVRRNNNSFSFDSSLNSVSAIKSALFEPANSLSSEDENESEGSLKSPASPGAWPVASKQINYHSLSPLPLLGSFEESVLNGRLEPVSTVQGFTAELGASGSFCPRHLYLPVTVFFYTLGDNDKVSAPYLGHINLGKKGYNVPRSGTIQVTLFNPLRTVVKMFVVVYDLSDMPPNSHTFLRQRTLYVPTGQKEFVETDKGKTPFGQGDYHKYLRYLIHLRFVSGKTGRIYLHTDIRMVIFRKADEDTATALGKQADGETYELRSHTHGPINPKFSPRK